MRNKYHLAPPKSSVPFQIPSFFLKAAIVLTLNAIDKFWSWCQRNGMGIYSFTYETSFAQYSNIIHATAHRWPFVSRFHITVYGYLTVFIPLVLIDSWLIPRSWLPRIMSLINLLCLTCVAHMFTFINIKSQPLQLWWRAPTLVENWPYHFQFLESWNGSPFLISGFCDTF